jgi:hypothetical protein
MVNLQEFLDQHEYTVLNRMNIHYGLDDEGGGWGSNIVEFIIDNLNYFSRHFDIVDPDDIKIIGRGSFNTIVQTNICIKGKPDSCKPVAIRINSKPTLIDTKNTKDNNDELLFAMGAYKSDFGVPIHEIFQLQYNQEFVQVIIMKLYTSDVKTLLKEPVNDNDMLMNIINTVNDIIIFMINNFDMLCLDIKFENFVAEYDQYDVKDIKMIDFGADFCSNLGNVNNIQDKDIYIILSTLLLYISAVSIYTVNKNDEYLRRINIIFGGPLKEINTNKKDIDTYIEESKFRRDILKVLNHYYAYINHNFNMGSNSIEELIDNINRRFVNKFNNNSNFGYAKIAAETLEVITYPYDKQPDVYKQPYKPPVNNMKTFDSISKDLLDEFNKDPDFEKTFNKTFNKKNMFTDFYKSIENIIKNNKVTNKFGKSRKSTKRRKSRKSTKRRKSRKSTKRRKSRKSTKRRKSRKSTKRRKSN